MVDFGNGVVQAVSSVRNVVARRGISPQLTMSTFSGCRHNHAVPVDFLNLALPQRNIEKLAFTVGGEAVTWKFGIDIDFGTFPQTLPSSTTDNFHVYNYEVGTKITMAIFAKQAANEDSTAIDDSVEDDVCLKQVYGRADEISIYTGSILEVGEKHFVHDINNYRGCSGAITFLLDGPNAGYCIGVHIGRGPDIEPHINLGIKIHQR